VTIRRLLMAARGGGAYVPPPGAEAVYALFNGSITGATYAIGAATKSGGTWTKYGSNPVLNVGAGGAWDDVAVKDPSLHWDGSQYVCYYAGLDGGKYQIGRATASSVTGTWTKYGSNPVIAVGAGGSFDVSGCSFPAVLHEPTDTGKEWKCWYTAYDGSVQRIGYAYSSNGTSWTKVGQVLDIGAGGSWEDVGIGAGAVIKSGATYHLFYGGRQGATNPRWQGGVATFTDPAGTYTKHPGNPVMLARFNDAGSSLVLTANATGLTLQVTNTAGWRVGEPMAIADSASPTDIRTIASIDSGTQATLDSALSSSFLTIHGATARPFAFNSIYPRGIRSAPGGGFEAFVTPFQPVEDLSPGGTKLREGSMRMTASALTGPWSYDYTTGLLWPLGAPSAWDQFSAENPSAIAAP